MAYNDVYGPLDSISNTISPLPTGHRNGLIAIAVCGLLSFVTTTTLFLFLTYKLIIWCMRPVQEGDAHQTPANDLSLGLAQRNFAKKAIPEQGISRQRRKKGSPNQFLILVYNLFFADMHQSTAFLLNIPWIQRNEITVGDPTCWTQGWFVSIGDLSASCFVCAIAVHTYVTVVKGCNPPQRPFYIAITCLWIFIYAIATIGVVATNNGKGAGGFYVRAAAWCWINVRFEKLRLWLHYFWIFLSLFVTSVLYVLIFVFLQQKKNSLQPLSHSRPSASTRPRKTSKPPDPSGYHPAFLIYPVIYMLCTAPLALGRVFTMAGRDVSIAYFCAAGAMIASNGWLDVLLFSTTRYSIIFEAPLDSENTGLETFLFMRTPHWRLYGNMIWVQGGAQNTDDEEGQRHRKRRKAVWGLDRLGQLVGRGGRDGRSKIGGRSSGSQESLRGIMRRAETGIQMDTVTTVVVEIEQDLGNTKTSSREPSAHSIDSSEKEMAYRVGSLRL